MEKEKERFAFLHFICELVMAFIFIVSALYTYREVLPNDMYELTFLSNLLAGLFLLTSVLMQFNGIKTPSCLYLDFTVLLLIVLGVCVAFSGQFSFEGGFLFLHIINPVLMLLFYLFLVDGTDSRWKSVFSILIMPVAYLIFMLVFGTVTGNYIYFFMDTSTYGIWYAVVFLVGILCGCTITGFGLYQINRSIHKRKRSKK